MSDSRSIDAGPAQPAGAPLLAERLARTVCELDPNPRNAFAVTVLLEVLGYTDARAMELGYADVFALEDPRENRAQTLTRLSGSHCLHTLIILSAIDSSKAKATILD